MQIVSQQGRPWWLRFADEDDNIEKLQTAELNLSFLCRSINMCLLVIEQYSPNLRLGRHFELLVPGQTEN